MTKDYDDIIQFAQNRFLAENLIKHLKEFFGNAENSKITNLLNTIDQHFYNSGGNNFEQSIDLYDLEDENCIIHYNLDNLLSVQANIKKLKILLRNSNDIPTNQKQLDIIFNLEAVIEEIISFMRNTL